VDKLNDVAFQGSRPGTLVQTGTAGKKRHVFPESSLQSSKWLDASHDEKRQYVFPESSLQPSKWLDASHLEANFSATMKDSRPLDGDPDPREIFGSGGRIKDGTPIFYLVDASGRISELGWTLMFRRCFNAAVPAEFIPDYGIPPDHVDVIEGLRGWVSEDKSSRGTRRGRISVGSAKATTDVQHWFVESGRSALIPRILAEPKPACVQHYLTQPEGGGSQLRHYGHTDRTFIRGAKRYWPARPEDVNEPRKVAQPADQIQAPFSQLTHVRPAPPGTAFSWTIRFSNLRDWELGALLWALQPRRHDQTGVIDPGYKSVHQIGMGKPLGLGSVTVGQLELRLEQRIGREGRYGRLFDLESSSWWNPEPQEREGRPSTPDEFRERFELLMAKALKLDGEVSFCTHSRVQALLEMMDARGVPASSRRQMTIAVGRNERNENERNEFQARRVLPGAQDVAKSGR
jgi:CRISPR-associated protein (TIGR03986 family)